MRYVRKNPPDIHKLLQDNFQIVQMTKKKYKKKNPNEHFCRHTLALAGNVGNY